MICDDHGGVLTCGERECSIQRRHQKLIEESPSPALDAGLREEMESAAERACRHIGYRNAGTFEFLVGPDGSFSFIELNARLQVEHPVTELVTQLDLVRMQVEVAAGEHAAPHGARAAIGTRDRDQDQRRGPVARVRASPGTVERFRPPLGPGVRVDTFVEDGTTISPYYDSLIAKVIVHDATREAAIARALRTSASSTWSECRRRGMRRSTSSRATSFAAASTRPRSSRMPARAAGTGGHDVRLAQRGGSITVADGALTRIVIQAAEAVDGARVHRPRRHIGIDVQASGRRSSWSSPSPTGRCCPRSPGTSRSSVAAALGSMCGFEVGAVDVSVEELD